MREWAQLDRLYRELPTIECQQLCHVSCGPIALQRAEVTRIERRLRGPIPPPANTLDCPLLTRRGTCAVHGVRPLICRLWGVVESMPCTFGCQPSRMLTDEEGRDFLRRALAIDPETVIFGDDATRLITLSLRGGRR